MIRSGSCTSDLAITTFCWLPPESSTTFMAFPVERTLSFSTHELPILSASRRDRKKRPPGNAVAHRLVMQDDLAAVKEVALEHAGDDLECLGAAGADQAEHAGDLSGEHRKRVILDHRRHFEVLHREHPRAGGPHRGLARAIERVRQIAPDHRLHDPGTADFR